MKIANRQVGIAIAVPALLVLALSSGEARPPAAPLADAQARVVPDCAALAIVKDANRYIQDRLTKPQPSVYRPKPIPVSAVRANALMIVLVAQHRMNAPGADAARLATLRDTAIRLAAEVEKTPANLTEINRLATLLDKFPEVPADRSASRAGVRVKDTFNHDDVVDLLGSCGSSRTQRLEFQLFQLSRRKTAYSEADSDQIELLAYKIALIAELNREFDDLVPQTRAKERPDWAKLADNVQENSWQLAESAKGRNSDEIRFSLKAVTNSCNDCHVKFRD